MTQHKLRAGAAYWDPAKPGIIASLAKTPEEMSRDELESLVVELDRRFIQLWDKVTYERVTQTARQVLAATLTNAELTAIYNEANGLNPQRLNPITTERIFTAMRATAAKGAS
jgi:hypothetical protein